MKATPIISSLLRKYSNPVPRYTSYPTAVEFSSPFPTHTWLQMIRELSATEPLSLYVHVPFCPSPCYFCACNKVITKRQDLIESYLSALKDEISWYRSLVGCDHPLLQLHFGGGSPSYLSTDQFKSLFEHLRSCFPRIDRTTEVAIEIDPRTVDGAKLALYAELGVTRLSFGVQDFDRAVQTLVNRVQPFELTADLMARARDLRFSGINIDLIYGLPGQSQRSLRETILKVQELAPDRIALYGYAHVPWLKRVQKSFEEAGLPSPAERIELFEVAREMLQGAGYQRIGMDHFALRNDELSVAFEKGILRRNFMGYTVKRTESLLGFGVSAISSLPSGMTQNNSVLDEYIENWKQGNPAIKRGLLCSDDDRIRGDVIQSLFCLGMISIASIEKNWNIKFNQYFSDELAQLNQLKEDNLVAVTDKEISLVPGTEHFIRYVASTFDAYLWRHRAAAAPRFSQGI